MSRYFRELRKEIDAGRKGENGVIPLPLGRLGNFLDISKGTMVTIGAETSGGKTAFALDQFMIHPMVWYHENKDKVNIKLDIKYFCMERSHTMNEAKMISKFIFEQTGYLISSKKMVGRTNDKLTDDELNLIDRQQKYEDEITKVLKVYEGHQTVESIERILEEHAREIGEPTQVMDDDGKMVNVWQNKHPNHITLIIVDHIGLLGRDKSEIDRFSTLMRKCKDYYKFSPIILQQLNREISQHGRSGPKSKPKLSDFEGSASTQQDSEIVIAVYNPFTHCTIDYESEEPVYDACGYDLKKLKDMWGNVIYRSVHILKNTYGGAGMSGGFAFHGPTGSFAEIPTFDTITDYDYEQITNSRMFTKHKRDLFDR